MKLITIDFNKSKCSRLDEQLTIATMMAVKSVGDMVSWRYFKKGLSFCILCDEDFIRFSLNRTDDRVSKKMMRFMEMSFGKPRRTFTKESSIDPGLFIYYMEWNRSVCDDIRELIS